MNHEQKHQPPQLHHHHLNSSIVTTKKTTLHKQRSVGCGIQIKDDGDSDSDLMVVEDHLTMWNFQNSVTFSENYTN